VTASETGSDESFSKIQAEIEKRDRDDSSRSLAPLIKPEGAVYVDTTEKGIDEVVDLLVKALGERP
jgi:cytidylate kinase